MQLAWKVPEGSNIKLQDYDPGYVDEHTDPALARAELQQLGAELGELQELLAAAHHHSLLIVLQGMDASGKAGSIREVMSHINPQGCLVRSFKVPTLRELDHDFLWRVHRATPGKGMVGIFNRSHYEDVLVVRVHNLVPEMVWRQRYAAMNGFEHLLAQNDMIILKFYFYMSKEEQERRLLARQKDKRCLLFTFLFHLPALPGVGLWSRSTRAREDLVELLQCLCWHRNVERSQRLVKLLGRAWPNNRCSHHRICQQPAQGHLRRLL